jgi:tetratricopeptide (TPR) repeat protein
MKDKEVMKLATLVDKCLLDNNLADALAHSEKILAHNRSAGLAYKGVIALRQDLLDEAESYLLESFQVNKRQNLALANLIPVYIKKRNFKKAVAFGEQAFEAMPKNDGVATNYAAALLQEQQFDKALTILKPLLDESKPNISILSALISCYKSLFMKKESEEMLDIAEKFFGDKYEVMRLKADNLAESNPLKAITYYRSAIEKDNTNEIPTRWNMSLVQLRLEDFSEGWKNYDNGLLPEVGKIGRPIPILFNPEFRKINLEKFDKNMWSFVVCEQGIGDQVLFLGALNQFIADYPKTVLIAETRFHSILRRSFPEIPIYGYGFGPLMDSNFKNSNGFIPIGSIQKKYRGSVEEFESSKSIYLKNDEIKTKKFKEILLTKTGAKKIVGFSWKGGFWERAQRTKTIELELWDPIFKNEDHIFVSLQYGDTSKEKEYLTKKFKNVKWIDGFDFKKDIESWFSLICACDDIISVSTALVHFAGAAGKSVNLLLSDKGAPFIWGLERERSIAYNDIKIHRKKIEQTTEEFFNKVSHDVFFEEKI